MRHVADGQQAVEPAPDRRKTEPTIPPPLMARNDVGLRRWPRPAAISRRRISSGFCVIGSAVNEAREALDRGCDE
jgi:hypothetical protein